MSSLLEGVGEVMICFWDVSLMLAANVRLSSLDLPHDQGFHGVRRVVIFPCLRLRNLQRLDSIVLTELRKDEGTSS